MTLRYATKGDGVFYPQVDGAWVLYADHVTEVERVSANANASTVKVHAWPDLGGGQELPGAAQQDKNADRIINELYHDRARLERVVKRGVMLVDELHEALKGDDDEAVDWADKIVSRLDEWADGSRS